MQLLMAVLGLALATALWTGVQAINAEARASYAEAARATGSDVTRLAARDGAVIPTRTYVALRRAGWQVSPVVEGDTMFGAIQVHLIGVDPLTTPRRTGPGAASALGADVDLAGKGDLGRFLSKEGLMLVNAALATQLHGAATPPVAVTGGIPDGTAIVDIALAQRLLNSGDGLSYLVVGDSQPEGRPPLETIAPDLVLQSNGGEADLSRLTDSFHLNLTAFGLLAFVVGLFIVYSTIGLAFEQRRPVFRTLRALGVSARQLTALLLGELLILALVSGLAGIVIGYCIAALLLPDVSATLRGLYGADVPATLRFRPVWWLGGLAVALLGTVVSAAQSLWRIATLPLLAPAQPRAWARASEIALMRQSAVALALWAFGVAALVWGTGLIAGFAVLGALLLGSALLLPQLLSSALGLGRRLSRGPVAKWFWADARQQLPALSLSLMALMLALAANVGVGAMVGSFRLTFTGFLDQRLAAELYVDARSGDEAERMQAWLAQRVDALLPIATLDAELAGAKGEILGVSDHATYRDNWPLIQKGPDAWDRFSRGEAVFINEQMSRRNELKPGDSLGLPGGWTASIAGVYSDYGNPAGQVMLSLTAMRAHYPQVSETRFGIRTGDANIAELKSALAREFNIPAERIVNQRDLKMIGLDVFERTFAVTAALNVLTFGVAGFALFASLMTLSGMRLPQLAPLWAMGLTRFQLAALELARTLALAALTLVLAVPVGLSLGNVLLSVVNVEAFGWKIPMHIFPLEWLRLAGLSLIAALIAGLLPARRLARIAPSELLRVFAHER